MKISFRGVLPLLAASLLFAGVSCGPANDPAIVALAYIRATHSGDPDTAVRLLDIEQIVSRVDEVLVVVDSSGSETFLEDSIGRSNCACKPRPLRVPGHLHPVC